MKRDKYGCNSTLTTDEYIESLPEKFKEKYDYQDTIYKGCKEDIEFFCPLHGLQTMKADKHKSSKHGCRLCAKEVTLDARRAIGKTKFFKECSERYGSDLDTSSAEYVDMNTEVTIYCTIHNKSLKGLPKNIIKATPCKDCSLEHKSLINRKPENEVIKQSKEKFSVDFEFDFTNYKNCNSKILIKCPIHGWHTNSLTNHLASTTGCPQCFELVDKSTWNSISLEDNFRKLIELYGDKYSFFTEDIGKSRDYVRYYCKKHHNLKITRLSHLRDGFACNQCGDEVMASKLTGWYTPKKVEKNKEFYSKDDNHLYIIDMTDGRYKIGLAKHPSSRICSIREYSNTPDANYLELFSSNTYDCFFTEYYLHNLYRDKQFDYGFSWKGHTEVFTLTRKDLEDIKMIIKERLKL